MLIAPHFGLQPGSHLLGQCTVLATHNIEALLGGGKLYNELTAEELNAK